MITEEQLKHWKELCEKATPVPWNYTYDGSGDYSIGAGDPQIDCAIGMYSRRHNTIDNIAFIAAAREAMPKLIEEVERLKGELNAHFQLNAGIAEENARLREALEFYADVFKDMGKRAREALGGEK